MSNAGRKLLSALSLALLVGGCGIVQLDDCTGVGVYGLDVAVVDSTSGERLTVASTVTATQGPYWDSEEVSADRSQAALAFERTGTYRVVVTAEGYEPWVQTNVRVDETEDGCHVRTVHLTARMQPME